MAYRRTQHEKLHNIGRRLIETSALRDAEVNTIANNKGLFDGVLSRINAIEKVSKKPSYISYLVNHRLAFGSAFATVLFIGVFAIYLQQNSAGSVSHNIKDPEQHPDSARSEITPQVIVKGFTAGRAADLEPETQTPQPVIQQAVYRQLRPSGPTIQRASLDSSRNTEFYPVTYTGDGGESAKGGRVVRVDVPRSTLFAMGMNVPLENESPTVKADLLIGPDGVTRAIRLVD